MRKLSVFLVLLVAVGYFFMFPEDHAAELPFDGLTVGDPELLESLIAEEEARVEAERLAEFPELVEPPTLLDEAVQRELVEPQSGASALAPADDLGPLADEAFEDGSQPLPGDLAAVESMGVPISGRVVNAAGEPIAGVRVRVQHPYLPEVQGSSGPDGSFRLTPQELRGDLVLATTSWVLLGGRLTLESTVTDDYLIVVANPVLLHGSVVDEAGRPINGARIHGRAPTDTLVPFRIPALPLDHEVQHGTSNARGQFRIGPVPLLEGTQVEVRMDGYEPLVVDLPADPRAPLSIVLKRY